jgi:FkbM family methyltransferase
VFHAMRRKIKHGLLERWRIPHSPIPGLPPCIYSHFRGHGAITLVDVGAHRGHFAKAVERLCGISSAVLVEPIEELANELRAEFDNKTYRVFECVVSDRRGEIEMQIFPHALCVSSLLSPNNAIEDMRIATKGNPIFVKRTARTLDEIIAETQLGSIDLVKIDVQGTEHLVLSGASRTLENTTAVYTEVSFRPLYLNSAVFSDIYAIMNKQGFFLTALEPDFAAARGELLQANALFLRNRRGGSGACP